VIGHPRRNNTRRHSARSPLRIQRRRSIGRLPFPSITFRLRALHRATRSRRRTLEKPIASRRHRRYRTSRPRCHLRPWRIRHRRTRNRARMSRGIQRHTATGSRGRGCCGRLTAPDATRHAPRPHAVFDRLPRVTRVRSRICPAIVRQRSSRRRTLEHQREQRRAQL